MKGDVFFGEKSGGGLIVTAVTGIIEDLYQIDQKVGMQEEIYIDVKEYSESIPEDSVDGRGRVDSYFCCYRLFI